MTIGEPNVLVWSNHTEVSGSFASAMYVSVTLAPLGRPASRAARHAARALQRGIATGQAERFGDAQSAAVEHG